jgi:hypothetical protein
MQLVSVGVKLGLLHEPSVFENGVLRDMLQCEGGGEEGRGWRELRNEELHNFCSLSKVIKVVKSKGDEMDMTCSKHGTEKWTQNFGRKT